MRRYCFFIYLYNRNVIEVLENSIADELLMCICVKELRLTPILLNGCRFNC